MKNQNDLIVAGALVLVCIGVSIGFMMTARKPTPPPVPAPINVSEAQPPQVGVAMDNSLPGGRGGSASSPSGGTRKGR